MGTRPPRTGRRPSRACSPDRRRRQRVQAPVRRVRAERRAVVQELKSGAQGRRPSSTSRLTRTAKANRSRGTSSRCWPQVPVKRMVFHEITKPAIERAVDEWRDLDRPGRRPGDPPHPRPPVRLRGLAGAVEEGHAAAVGRAGPERRHPHPRRARAGPHALPFRRLVGHRRHVRLSDRRSAPPSSRSTAPGWRPARTSTKSGLLTAEGPRRARPEPAEGRRALARAPRRSVRSGWRRGPIRPAPKPPFMTSTLQQEAGPQAPPRCP